MISQYVDADYYRKQMKNMTMYLVFYFCVDWSREGTPADYIVPLSVKEMTFKYDFVVNL